jgi:hypothetical protein
MMRGNDSFISSFCFTGVISLSRFLLLFYTIVTVIKLTDQFFKLYPEEALHIEQAARRYKHNCEIQDVKQAIIFKMDCERDARIKNRNAYWETLVGVAKRKDMCGEEGCGTGMMLFASYILGIISVVYFLPSIHKYLYATLSEYKRRQKGDHITPFRTYGSAFDDEFKDPLKVV